MPKAKISDWAIVLAAVCASVSAAQGQVLDQVIEQAKEAKKRQLAAGSLPAGSGAPGGSSVASPAVAELPVAVPELWSVAGINGELQAEIWLGDAVHRIPLRTGERLPGGWLLQEIDDTGLLFVRGKGANLRQVRLRPTPKGSTGWEYAAVPRSAAQATATSSPTAGAVGARAAASNLPLLPAAQVPAPAPVR